MRRLTNSYDDICDAGGAPRQSISSFRSARSLGGTLLLEDDASDKGVVFISISLFMTIVGTGMLAMPMTLMKMGIDGFIASIFIVSVMTIIGYYLTYRTLDMVPSCNMDIAEIGKLLLGKPGFYISLFICILDTWGTVVGNIRAVTEVVKSMHPGLSDSFIIIAVIVCAWPLTFKQKLSDLRVAGLFATCAIFLFTGYITWEGMVMSQSVGSTPSWNGFYKAAPSFGVILFSYDSQVNLYPLYREMRGPAGGGGKSSLLTLISVIAVIGASLVYAVVGISGVLLYPENVNGNILVNMRDEWFVKATFATAIFLSLPILAHECTVLITRYLAPFAIHGGPSLLLLGLAGYAANTFHMFSAFRYVGSTTGVLFSAVLPPLFFIAASRRNVRPNLSQIPLVDSVPFMTDSPLPNTYIPQSRFGRSNTGSAITGSTFEIIGASLFLAVGVTLVPLLLLL
eukprot:TRINITY_DN15821_c0_g1_i1.p1 TRINITY_DN15821_c0_g1~~TRINITY_DN15821_c0_g1_i1.p1  ORF type:complete len:455 (+),score=40.29 TRINITY_DN15821_c0_g1_i1:2-1366(+)